MTTFFIALTAVLVLLLTASPGFLLIRRRMISESCIPGASKILLFVCQPCLAVYTITSAEFSWETLSRMGQFALLALAIHAVMLGGVYLILRQRCENPIYRIATIATTFANCAFFGIPIIEALFPEVAHELLVYTTMYALVMNVLGWTVGSAIISRDTSYIRVKKILLNPATIGAGIGLLLFVMRVPLPGALDDMVSILGRMCSPLSMLIMGMRLGTMRMKDVFSNLRAYAVVAVKGFVMPAVAFLLVVFLPLDVYVKRVFYIIACCPSASIVLNYAEIVGEGQSEAANTVLLSTILSALTLPVMTVFLTFL